jgi:small GTP-binding protein
MSAMTALDELHAALDTLERLAGPADVETLAELRGRVADHRLRVLVAGEAKRGKSTLINRLLDRDVLPTGVTPVTAVATTLRAADAAGEYVVARLLDGRVERLPLDDLAGLVSERLNPENVRGIRDVTVALHSALLADFAVELVDTPGTGSVFRHNTEAAESAFGTLDAAVLVVSADPPISAAETGLLRDIAEHSVRTFVVLNKADLLDEEELAEAVGFTRRVVAAVLGDEVPLYACSARRGPDDAGFGAFAAALRDWFTGSARDDLLTALRGHLLRQAVAMRDEVVLTQRTLEVAASSAADRVEAFRARLGAIAARRGDIEDRCATAARRARRELDAATSAGVNATTAEVVAAVRRHLDELSAVTAAEIEERGRARAADLIREAVMRWQAERAAGLQALLDEAVAAATGELDSQLAAVRDAARELLGAELGSGDITPRLGEGRGFRFAFEPGIGWEVPFADATRRLLPGAVSRARHRLLAEIPLLVDRQYGRARGDLVERFAEGVAAAARSLTAEHDRALHRVSAALNTAAAIAADSSAARQERTAALAQRRQGLDAVIETLEAGRPQPEPGRP